jgi:dTDP-4-dehydrorhamnose reductase
VTRQRVVVVGAAGRLGGRLCRDLESAGRDVVALSRVDLDVTDAAAVARVIGGCEPHGVINCSAYNAVDAAETAAADAFAVNALAPGVLARAAAASGALFVHYGTDFVFDGYSRKPYVESDPANPLSAYGSSKLAGEVEVRRSIGRHYILRVASLFGGTGVRDHRPTIDAIADLCASGKTVRALVDRTVSPSHVSDVSRATCELLDGAAEYGTYHIVSSGDPTWYDLACHVAASLGVSTRIEPLTSAELKTVARRPQYCALSNAKLRAAGVTMPDWRSAVSDHLRSRMTHVVPATL